MTAIFQGRRWRVVAESAHTVQLERTGDRHAKPVSVARVHRDLILHPTPEDLVLAEAFERGEISAFEYEDGHTYPPNREIPTRGPRPRSPKTH